MHLRLTFFGVTAALIGAVGWPSASPLDAYDSLTAGATWGALIGLCIGAAGECYLALRGQLTRPNGTPSGPTEAAPSASPTAGSSRRDF